MGELNFRKKLIEDFINVLNEKGLEWKKGWNVNETNILKPKNAISGVEYSGLNRLYLFLVSQERGYGDNRWATYNQIKEKGYKLKNALGQGVKIEYWYPYDTEEKKSISWKELEELNEKIGNRYLLRQSLATVFNGDLIEGLPENKNKEKFNGTSLNESIERMRENIGVEIVHDGGNVAYYSITEDKIHLPKKEFFNGDYEYNSTALHELGHATGHEKRLNRKMRNLFGSKDYAYEELIAEITSCFTGAELGLNQTEYHIQNHKAYVKDWISILKDNPNSLFNAIREAEEVSDYLVKQVGLSLNLQKALEIKTEDKVLDNEVTLDYLKRNVRIIDYASHLGLTVVKEGKVYSLKEHDSCKIYDDTNTFYRFSTKAGGSIIDFIQEFEGLKLYHAISQLESYYKENKDRIKEYIPLEKNTLKGLKNENIEIPQKASNNKAIIWYLMHKRGIDYQIIKEYLQRGLIYQDTRNNLVMVGKYNNKPMCIQKRGTNSSFKGEVENSLSDVGFYLNNNSKTLIITESVIDQMSYINLYDKEMKNDYLSVNGVAKNIVCTKWNLENRLSKIETIVIAFDNDREGNKKSQELKDWINYYNSDFKVEIANSKSKDLNEDLLNYKAYESELPTFEQELKSLREESIEYMIEEGYIKKL